MREDQIEVGGEYIVSSFEKYENYPSFDVEHVRVIGPPYWWSVARWMPSVAIVVPVHVERFGEWYTRDGMWRRLDHFRGTWAEYEARRAEQEENHA